MPGVPRELAEHTLEVNKDCMTYQAKAPAICKR
jgi:hypothetical protein